MNKPYSIFDQNAVYFITMTVVDWIDVFTRKEYKYEVVDSLNYCIANKGLELYAWCLMTNHLHLLGLVKEPLKMSDFIRDFKRHVSNKIIQSMEKEYIESRRKWILDRMEFRGSQIGSNRNYKFWETGNHAIEIHSTKFFEQKLHYIHQNPVEAMIVEEEEHYLFSSARDYAGVKGLVRVSLY